MRMDCSPEPRLQRKTSPTLHDCLLKFSSAPEFGINFMGASSDELVFTALIEDPFVLACRRDDPVAARARLTWRDLDGQPLIGVSRSSGNRLLLDAVLAKTTLRLNWLYEVHHLTTS